MKENLQSPKVTVIIPSLNVAPYIKACVDSVCGQNLREMEILAIDAGSADGTVEILEQYKENPRFHLIHSDKKSYGYQMNLGISQAKGAYISIVESDDLLSGRDSLAWLYQKAEESGADYVKGTASMFFDKGGRFTEIAPILPHPGLKQADEVECVPKESPFLFETDNFLWTGLYRTEFIRRFPFRETSGAAFQDISVLFRMLSSAEKAVYTNQKLYFYRQDNMLASSYNPQSLQFVLSEYDSLEERLQGLPEGWIHMYYMKLAKLAINRFEFMAASGRYWEESRAAIGEIQEKLRAAVKKQLLRCEDFGDDPSDRFRQTLQFIEDPQKLYLGLKETFDQAQRNMESLLRWIGKSSVVIVGSGQRGRQLAAMLILLSVPVDAFWDNNQALWGNEVLGIPVKSPQNQAKENRKYIIANKLHPLELKKQLLGLGVKETDIGTFQPEAWMPLLQRLFY